MNGSQNLRCIRLLSGLSVEHLAVVLGAAGRRAHMVTAIRIFIADPRPAVRAALTLLLELEPGLRIVGEAGDGAELIACLAAVRPDVVLLEWELLTAPLADVLTDVHTQDLHPQVIVLSSRPEVRQLACAAGADGFVSKGDPPGRLLTLLRGLAQEEDRPR